MTKMTEQDLKDAVPLADQIIAALTKSTVRPPCAVAAIAIAAAAMTVLGNAGLRATLELIDHYFTNLGGDRRSDRGVLYGAIATVLSDENMLTIEAFAMADVPERQRIFDRLIDACSGRLPPAHSRSLAAHRVEQELRGRAGFDQIMDSLDPRTRQDVVEAIVGAVAAYQKPPRPDHATEPHRYVAAYNRMQVAAQLALQIARRGIISPSLAPAHVIRQITDLERELDAPVVGNSDRRMFAVMVRDAKPAGTGDGSARSGDLVMVEVPRSCTIHELDASRLVQIVSLAHELGDASRAGDRQDHVDGLVTQLAELTAP